MTRKCVSDEKYGKLQRKLGELARRIDEGTLEYGGNLMMLQMAIEGKLFDHVKNGGLVLSRPMSVDVSMKAIPERLPRSPCGNGVSDDLMHELFMSYRAPTTRISIQTACFDFFGDRQPSTAEVTEKLGARGFRQATALELYCASQQHKLKTGAEAEYIVALDTQHCGHKKILSCEYNFALGPCFDVAVRDEPWWPPCYRFAVVKEEKR